MKNRSGHKTCNRRSAAAMLMAVLLASTTIIPAFSSGGEIHLINDLGGYGGETSIEEQMERDWNEDLVAVAKGAWLDAHAGEDRERRQEAEKATASGLSVSNSAENTDIPKEQKASDSNLSINTAPAEVPAAYDVFEDIDEGAAANAVASYLKTAKKDEKKESGEFLRAMLKEALIPEAGVPRDSSLKKEILALDKMNDEDYQVFRTDREYTPSAGDIIFVAGHINTGESSPASASEAKKKEKVKTADNAPSPVSIDTKATASELAKEAAETEKSLKRNAKRAALAGIIIAGPEDTGSDKIHFIYSTEKEKVEIGVIAKSEVRIIGYADMEELHDKYCGILEEEEAEDSEETALENPVPNEKTRYTWKDDNLTVMAVLTDPEAVPDDAELVVTSITKETEGYNYQAYMDALTGEITSAGEKNTVLYDVAFLADEKDENGEKTGRTIEIQPENDKVKVTFRFNSAKLKSCICL